MTPDRTLDGLPIRDELAPQALRRHARHERNRRAALALRMLAIANALEGMSQAEAARLVSMERQALHDAGASAVFFRQADLDAYRHEAAAIVSFWARHQRLDAVGM